MLSWLPTGTKAEQDQGRGANRCEVCLEAGMQAGTHSHSNQHAAREQGTARTKAHTSEALGHAMHQASIYERARHDPKTLTTKDMLYLLLSIDNHSVTRMPHANIPLCHVQSTHHADSHT